VPPVQSTQAVLEAALSGAMERQTALTSDLANADTPGFKPRDVDFEDQLTAAMQAGTPVGQINYQSTPSTGLEATGGVGVNTDAVSADIAQNGLEYQALSQIMAANISIARYAMESQ
jgi:flagellar basal-body rod protein FlgB